MSIGLLWGDTNGAPVQIPEAMVEAERQALAAALKADEEPDAPSPRPLRQAWAWCRSRR